MPAARHLYPSRVGLVERLHGSRSRTSLAESAREGLPPLINPSTASPPSGPLPPVPPYSPPIPNQVTRRHRPLDEIAVDLTIAREIARDLEDELWLELDNYVNAMVSQLLSFIVVLISQL
jgi:hypothetical protein